MRYIFIVNPAAYGGKCLKLWSTLERCLSIKDLHEKVFFTEAPAHATEIAREAVIQGVERVFAVGGDGTVQEVANGLARSQCTLVPVPTGRGNDFARALRMPVNPLQSVCAGLSGETRTIDLGWVQTRSVKRCFVNVASVGFDAEVAREVYQSGGRIGGTLAYLRGLVRTLSRYRSAEVEIMVDGMLRFDTEVLFVAAGNTPFYGGGMKMLPKAVPDDGLLDLCVCSGLSKMETLRCLPMVYSGAHLGHPKASFLRAEEITVASTIPLSVQADGEMVGASPVTFGILPSALRVIDTGNTSGRSS